MSVLADIYHGKKKKRCTMCGCLLLPDSEGNICECCLDDMYRDEEDEECLYPNLIITTDIDRFKEIVNRRISGNRDGYSLDFATIDEVHNWPKENPFLYGTFLKPGGSEEVEE